MSAQFQEFLQHYQQHIQGVLSEILPCPSDELQRLQQAMAYVVLAGGKRLRPLLIYAIGDAFAADTQALDYPAAAVEFIHAYSLVHDDLPAMDNDDLRRGKPTCHKAYDEATAILVGDALQSLAFQTLTEAALIPAATRLKMLAILARAAGAVGMVGGQLLDLQAEKNVPALPQLEYMYRLKTGALLTASVQLGALASGCNDDSQEFQQLTQFAECMGLAFQIQDDVLDIESSTQTLGKQQGADAARNKPTYPALVGLEVAKQKVQVLYEQALHYLPEKLDTGRLFELTEYMIQRKS